MKSIRNYYKQIDILIVDDSLNDDLVFYKNDPKIKYVKLSYNIGLSHGRNVALKHVNTKYFILLDDDFYFTKKTNIKHLYELIKSKEHDILAFDLYDFGFVRRDYKGYYKKINDTLILEIENNNKIVCETYDFVLNCFIAKKCSVQNVGWDANIKIGYEHDDFFIRAKNKGISIGHTNQVSLKHFPKHKPSFGGIRNNTDTYFNYFMKKHCVTKVIRKYRKKNFTKTVLYFILSRINKIFHIGPKCY